MSDTELKNLISTYQKTLTNPRSTSADVSTAIGKAQTVFNTLLQRGSDKDKFEVLDMADDFIWSKSIDQQYSDLALKLQVNGGTITLNDNDLNAKSGSDINNLKSDFLCYTKAKKFVHMLELTGENSSSKKDVQVLLSQFNSNLSHQMSLIKNMCAANKLVSLCKDAGLNAYKALKPNEKTAFNGSKYCKSEFHFNGKIYNINYTPRNGKCEPFYYQKPGFPYEDFDKDYRRYKIVQAKARKS